MTDERFIFKDFPHGAGLERRIYDTKNEKDYDFTFKSQDDLCDLLNDLIEEIQHLKKVNHGILDGFNYYQEKSEILSEKLYEMERDYKREIANIEQDYSELHQELECLKK